MGPYASEGQETPCIWLHDFSHLLRTTANLDKLSKDVGAINPRHPGLHNHVVQLLKRALGRSLAWYTRPVHEFNSSVTQSLEEMAGALDHLYMTVLALDRARPAPATVATPARFARDRTAYIIGLFGTGRLYVNDLIRAHLGERAKYLRDTIRLHPGPTPMIYSGHTTMKYSSAEQFSPEISGRILEAVHSGFADLIFIYRHPLDSLLTNWVWWRTWLREKSRVSGVSAVYKNSDELCAALDANFSEFRAFAQGDGEFFARDAPAAGFLSFAEFVEETELHLQAATLALRLEDFMTDPVKQFARIAAAMSVDVDLRGLNMSRPRTKAYGYRTVMEKVPRFREFIAGLDGATKARIGKLGYAVM